MDLYSIINFCLLIQLALAKLHRNSSRAQTRIFGGTTATDAQFPHQGYLSYNGQMRCSGSIIHSRWALTAAHCVLQEANPLFTVGTIYVGGSDGISYNIKTFIAHPKFELDVTGNAPYTQDRVIVTYDICLMRLASDIQFDYYKVKPIPLARDTATDYDYQPVSISGWGQSQYGEVASSVLLYAYVPVMPLSVCNVYVHYYLSDELTVCASNVNEETACMGDSGSPLVLNGQQIGIASVAGDEQCAATSKPVVYTRVSTFIPWIQGTLVMFGDYI